MKKMSIRYMQSRAAYIRANAHRHPDLRVQANLFESAQRYDHKVRVRKRLRVAGWSAAAVSGPALLLVPSAYAGWAGLGAEMLVGGIGGPIALGALAFEAFHLLKRLEEQRPMHESARIAEMQDRRDREPAEPRRPSRVTVPPRVDADGHMHDERRRPQGRVIDGEFEVTR